MARGEKRPRVSIEWPMSYAEIALRLVLGWKKPQIMEELGITEAAYDRRMTRIKIAAGQALMASPVEKRPPSRLPDALDLIDRARAIVLEDINR